MERLEQSTVLGTGSLNVIQMNLCELSETKDYGARRPQKIIHLGKISRKILSREPEHYYRNGREYRVSDRFYYQHIGHMENRDRFVCWSREIYPEEDKKIVLSRTYYKE